MSEINRREYKNYSVGTVDTPFGSKTQAYDLPIGSYRHKAYQYRTLTFIFLGLSVLLSAYFISLTKQPANRVFAAQMSHKGFVSKVGLLNENYTVSPQLVKDFISRYIHVWFTGEVNNKTVAQNTDLIKSFASSEVNKRFHQFMDTNALKGWNTPIVLDNVKILDDGEVSFVVKLPKAGEEGKLMGYNTISGRFKIVLLTNNQKLQVIENPFGFYIKSAKLELEGINK